MELEDRDVVVNFSAMFLCDALWNPDYVTALLLLELQVWVEDTKVELLHEAVDVQLDLVLEKFVLQCLLARIISSAFKQLAVLSVVFGNGANLFVIVSASQCGKTVGIEAAARRVKFDTIILREFGAERIDSDDQGPAIGLELQCKGSILETTN